MTKLSVNINKVATLRNSRGGNIPDVLKTAKDIQEYGGQGITIHPRPDQRHIRYEDALALKSVVNTEFNIEGNPIPRFIDLVLEICPDQVTLVPDPPDAITSDSGWNTVKYQGFLKQTIEIFKQEGIRVSIFVDPIPDMISAARDTGTDRVELYTENYANNYSIDKQKGIEPYIKAAKRANQLGIGINAGHDLNLENLAYFNQHIDNLLEVSIGHALICDSLYYGLENVVGMYLNLLN
ncbi:MAG: pyridoxine 5'-phosphate synthase [Flavobacteriaceae bacterium]|nr:pyridoxine 5'-phosphate synthase [Flavobacteriaceae bacterium]